MSVNLLKLIVNTTTLNFLKVPLRAGLQNRLMTNMEISPIKEHKDKQIVETHNVAYSKSSTRFRKRQRQWEDGSNISAEEIKEKTLCDENGEKIKRKKMAMLLGYCGVDYYGMQRNPGVRTIEEDLLKALLEARYITQDGFQNQQNTQFQRSSRTDKGVSAARQVVSLKIPVNSSVEEINKRLPECIKVFGVKRVTNKFNSKVKCSARTYSYTAPTYVFDAGVVSEEDRKSYRISSEKLEEINRILAMYQGTKNYHNFTEKKFFQDPSSSRFMMSFRVEKVFVESGMEFAVLLVKGQSFMLHQIRKMVGLTIAVIRGHTDLATFQKALSNEKVFIPTAPGLGLVLDMVHYDRYDAKHKQSHDSLTWDEHKDAVEKFKHEHIYPNIVKGEVEGNSMGVWLEKFAKHSYDKANYEETDGIDGNIDDDDDDGDDGECRKGCIDEDIDRNVGASDGKHVEDSNVGSIDGDIDAGKCTKECIDGDIDRNVGVSDGKRVEDSNLNSIETNIDRDSNEGRSIDNKSNIEVSKVMTDEKSEQECSKDAIA